MAVNRISPDFAYGIGDNLIQLAPRPIVAQRDPGVRDLAQLGTIWVNTVSGVFFGLASISAGSANWTSTPAAGSTTLADLTITGVGGLDVQNAASTTTISSSTINFDNAAALTTISGALTVAGTTTITGDIDLSSAALIDLTSTLNAAPSIYLHANGGVNEQIRIHADQGTSVNSVELDSDVGGITLVSGLASADAINLSATAGGIDIDGALQINIASSQNAADSIVITSSVGGIDILAAGAGAGEDIDIVATGSSVNINSTENVADSIVISSTNGGIDIFALGAAAGEDIDIVATGSSVNITSTEDVAQAIYLRANAGTSETIQIHADQGTGVASINVLSDVGGITLRSTGLASADAINLEAAAGGVDVDGALQVNIASSQAAVANSVRIVASAADGGMDIDAGTGGITIDSTGAISIDGAAASNVTVTGAGIDLTLSSVGGSVLVESTENAALAIRLHANGGVNETIQLHADQGTAVNSIDILSDVGGITLTATGLASADAINLNAAAGGVDIDGALQVNIASSQNAADALVLTSSAGGIDILATGAAAGEDIDIVATGSSVNINSTENVADSIVISSTNGGIDIFALGAAAGEDIDIVATGSSVNITSTEDVAQAIYIRANAGTSETIQLHADQGTGVSSINILSDVGGLTLRATGLASADAINLEAAAGGIDIDAALQINIASSQNAADSIVITSSAGGIDILAPGAAAGEDIDIIATGSSVNLTSTEATADAIVLNASNAAGGIDLLTGGGEITISSSGNVTMVPGTASVAGTSLTLNARVGVATFTGLTTAAAATETLTITNSALGAGDGIFCTVSNRGTNDAQMTLTRVNSQTAGTLIVQCDNNGAAALNGDLIVTFWIIN